MKQDIEDRLASVSKALHQALDDLERVQGLLQRETANGTRQKERELTRLLQVIGENLSETAIGFGMITQPTDEGNQAEEAE